jgi:ABC-type nitrate/sulfonate/bicarbonate transport system ATPase subunit
MVGLQVRGMSKSQARDVADKFLDSVGLGEFKASYPSQLSGGMAQRVGIARALALHPRLLLLDEPFAAVDAFTRLKLQDELRSMLELVNPTVILVTHDVSEAITLGDRIVVMTSRPGAVKSEIDVTARDHDKSSKDYAALLARVLSDLGVGSDNAGVSQ